MKALCATAMMLSFVMATTVPCFGTTGGECCLIRAVGADTTAGADFDEGDLLTALQPPSRVELMTAAEWQSFSDVIGDAFDNENDVEGLRFAALRLAIQYSDYLTLDRAAIFQMAGIYRNHNNDNVRRMAVVALASTGDSWATDYLKRSVQFEKTPKVLHTLKAVLQPEIIVGEPEPVASK